MNTTVQHNRETCTEGLECPRCYPGGDRFAFQRLVESKPDKAARMWREIAEYRVETLQDAARILGQLDERLVGPYTNAQRVSIEFLKQMAEAISKASKS